MENHQSPENSELGKKSAYETQYTPSLLFPIPRSGKREEIGIDPANIPFKGFDIWNHYEVSWLNSKGKPQVAIAVIVFPCESECIIESKSMKLYFNSLNNTTFDSLEAVSKTIEKDLSNGVQAPVQVNLELIGNGQPDLQEQLAGECVDHLDVECDTYLVEPAFLKASDEIVEETLTSDLLKSNCLVTYQPDWASVQISYQGPKIDREGLLKYIVSFRNHNEFHEQCIERIFADIQKHCQPTELTVYGRYTRRGGLDINPYRSTQSESPDALNLRLSRQ